MICRGPSSVIPTLKFFWELRAYAGGMDGVRLEQGVPTTSWTALFEM